MADPIILPPLPPGEVMGTYNGVPLVRYTADQMQARDLEIVRLVLEAAAKTTEGYWDGRQERFWAEACANAIRELEVKHGR